MKAMTTRRCSHASRHVMQPSAVTEYTRNTADWFWTTCWVLWSS